MKDDAKLGSPAVVDAGDETPNPFWFNVMRMLTQALVLLSLVVGLFAMLTAARWLLECWR